VTLVLSAAVAQYAYPLLSNASKTVDSEDMKEKAQSVNETSTAKPNTEDSTKNTKGDESSADSQSSFGASWFAQTFYDGGFEDKMTRREAALILGVCELSYTVTVNVHISDLCIIYCIGTRVCSSGKVETTS